MIFVWLVWLALLGCCAPANHEYARQSVVLQDKVRAFAEAAYPNFILYEESMMDDAALQLFKSDKVAQQPGIICGEFRGANRIDCALLLAHKELLDRGAWRLAYVMDAETKHPSIMPLETYDCIQYGMEVALLFLPKGEIPDREELTRVQMPGDGFEVVFYGHTSHAYFWDNGVLRKVYTSD